MPDPTIRSIDDYDRYLRETLADLQPDQRTAFAAAMAERYIPVYQAFSEAEDWGDPAAMRRSLDAVWEHLRGKVKTAKDLDRYAQMIEDSTPHMDDFDDAEAALAAAILVGQAVDCCRRVDNLEPTVQAAISGFEAVLPGWSDDPRDQLRLWQKNAVRQEFSQQMWLLEQIRAIDIFNEGVIKALRKQVTGKEHAGKIPKRRAPAGPPRLTNQVLFEQYRRMVEADIKSNSKGWGKLEAMPDMKPILRFSRWSGRYSRRRQTIDGSYGAPADQAAQQALVIRSKAKDAAVKGSPNWDPEARSMIEMALANPYSGLDANAVDAPHGYGPSMRRLWIEAKNQGYSDEEAWEQVVAWADHRPKAWEMEDRRKKKGLGSVFPGLIERLSRNISWRRTGDPEVPWETEVDGQRWQVRLNDFPDDFMYSLLIDGQDQGSFHDWPETWTRD